MSRRNIILADMAPTVMEVSLFLKVAIAESW
jgi:hypothetical protein